MKDQSKYKLASTKKWLDKESAGFTQSFLKTPPGMTIYKPKVGKAVLDIIPYTVGGLNPNADEGLLYWELTFWVHKGIGPNQSTFVCPARTLEQPCPVCEEKARIMKSNPNDEEFDAAKQLSPKEWQLIQIRDRNNKEKGIQLLPLSFHRFGDKIKDAIDAGSEADQWENFWHPTENGKILNVNWAEDSAGGGHKYVRAKTVIFTDRPQKLPDWLIGKGSCLDELLIVLDYDKLASLYSTGEEETEEEETEEAPPIKKKKKASAPPPDEDEEEETEEEEETPDEEEEASPLDDEEVPPDDEEEAPPEDEEEETEEAPPVKKKKKAAAPPPEEDEEEEEETPAPVKKKKAAAPPPEEDEEETPDEEEEEAPVKKKKAVQSPGKPAKKGGKPLNWDAFDAEEAPEDEEEAPPAPAKKLKKK